MSTVKMAVVYHKDAFKVQNDVFTPISVGGFSFAEKQNTFADNVGDNISAKNATYNELTAIYWMWKHYGELGNPDYVGLNHYRRFFIYKNSKYAYYETDAVDQTIFEKMNFSRRWLCEILSRYDFAAPVPNKRKSVYHNFKAAHRIEDLELAAEIVRRKYPDFAEVTDEYLAGDRAYFYNMFIFGREDFFRYCEWLFDILEEYENRTAHPDERIFASECLTGIYFTWLQKQGKRAAHLPVLFVKEKKPSFKTVVNSCKKNLRAKDMSKVYALKPLITYFVPNGVLMRRKRKSALKDKNI